METSALRKCQKTTKKWFFEPSSAGRRGQALVEFALIIPLFLILIVALAEFSFLLTVKVGVSDTAQDAVQLASELGNTANADCTVLQLVEKDMGAPIDKAKIQSVSFFWTDVTGANKGANTYVRTGTMTCANGGTVPYSSTANGYPIASRCNFVLGCGPGKPGVDWIGVTITYQYAWITPLPSLIGLQGSPPTFVQTNTSRLEPVQ